MQQVINIGAVPNDGTGDPLRVAFNKCNDNFNELYASGAVSSVGVVVANGITGSVANPTTTPVISLGLGAITPSSINGVILSGSSTPSLAVTGATSVSGANTGDITLAGTPDYITIAGQTITRNQIDLSTDVTSTLPVANGGTGVTSFGSGVATFLSTPSSANLAAAVTDETGTGSLVFSNSPALTTPDLGTPSAGTLTNCTIPYSKVNNIVSNRILARSTAGIGEAEILTASNVLDFITSTQGAITYRAAGQWFGLAPSTAGYVLTTNGVGANPSWSQVSLTAGVTGTLPVANGGTGVTTSTGTGSTVLSDAPTFTGQVTVAAGTVAAPAITFAGDPNTGIYSPLADTVCLVVNGTEALRCTSNNQIAIARTGTAATPSVVQSSDTNTGFYFPAADTLGLVTGGVERVRVDDVGRVGIGITSPATIGATVSIVSLNSSSGQLSVFTSDVGAVDTGGSIQFGGNDGSQAYRGWGLIACRKENSNSGNYASYMTFQTRGTGVTTERMRITSAGSVLINTAAVATTATDGFLYIPSCAGTPTGTPTAQTGRVPLVVDSTNNKLYFYSGGAWRDAGP